jgi:hypothetical protein
MIYKIIFICLSALGLGIHLAKHGEDRKEKFNFWMACVNAIICYSLLYGAGFLDRMF